MDPAAPSPGLHLDLDGAWSGLDLPTLPLTDWGPRLRFCAPPREIAAFYEEVAPRLRPFLVYGSGDFHHLSALWLRRQEGPLTLVSFDNHPDWDVRPPRWCCGSWVNRALERPELVRAVVWGCGNFECWGRHRWTGNRWEVARGRLEVHPWGDQRTPAERTLPHVITRANWRERFTSFAASLAGQRLYVTVDMDCFVSGAAATNWENGFFEPGDVVWALGQLRRGGARIVAGDLCGARSPATYARWAQRFASETDHPKLPAAPDPAREREINLALFRTVWPALSTPESGVR